MVIFEGFSWLGIVVCLSTVWQAHAERGGQFPPGLLKSIDQVPPSRFREGFERLPQVARDRAMNWLGGLHLTELDFQTLHIDHEGGIFYADPASAAPPAAAPVEPQPQAAPVPVSPFPSGLVFHSRPGAPNVIYLDFAGDNVNNTAWNNVVGRATIPAVAFSIDSDVTTYSDEEQAAIRRIWQRVAEDYSPFNVDVTTERPASFTTRTAHALITRNTDANGELNPSSDAGGVGYTDVFGTFNYAYYRPVWIYCNNLFWVDSYIAEAASHEVGHNLGLSHDGRTDGTEYYAGHGSGDISWGTIMGTGYGQNVTQWSKGEYYLANNTQDHLATIAGKLTYRTDDHGNTIASATPLTIRADGAVLSTNPETDPTNTNRVNKGVLERTTDVDAFSFTTGNGPILLHIDPWVMSSGTRGGNVDILAELYNVAGALLLTNNPELTTSARLETNLTEGVYYVLVRNTGVGSPLSSTPSGYTAYGCVGQYFISGTVVPSALVIPPSAELQVADITLPGVAARELTVTYTDNVGIDVASLDSNDLSIIGPAGYSRPARLVRVDASSNGSPRVATYAADPPSGSTWLAADNGTYTVSIQTNQVYDTEGASVPARVLGTFVVNVPVAVYVANMDTDPNWTLEPLWQYGTPNYVGGGPTAGATGSRVIAYNLSGNYENRLPFKYATTPAINCIGSGSLTLRFQRWLRIRNGDTAVVQVSTNGTMWTDLFNTSRSVSDNAWQDVFYSLPSWTAGCPTLRVRWGIASNFSQNDIGWNVDDVMILAGGSVDTTPPAGVLNAANLTDGGAPRYSFTVAYTDNTAVRFASIGSSNIVVTGPNGYTNSAQLVGVDPTADGSPLTASYSISAPGEVWGVTDNGSYQVILQDGQVSDIYNNAMPETQLGVFSVAIPPDTVNYKLKVSVNEPAWGAVTPASGTFPAGTTVQVTATPALYFTFVQWSGDVAGSNNPVTATMSADRSILAQFAEILTTNHPTPLWWLAEAGVTNDFENAVDAIGANGYPLWQSYIAGLNPNNPASQLRLSILKNPERNASVLSWVPCQGRYYSLEYSTNDTVTFYPLPGASDLPASVNSVTNKIDPLSLLTTYRISVRK